MAMIPMQYGEGLTQSTGATRTARWLDAVAKANSYIMAYFEFSASISNKPIGIVFTLPKDKITSTEKATFSGYYFNASSYGLFQMNYSTSDCSASLVVGGTTISTYTDTFYYD